MLIKALWTLGTRMPEIRKTSNQGLYFEEMTANALRGGKHHFLPWLTGSTGQPSNGCIH